MYDYLPYAFEVATGTKNDRLDLRLTQQQKHEIERAAAISGRTVTDSSVAALVKEAAEVIAHERDLVMSEQAWQAFTAVIERPARSIEGFAELLKRPSIFLE